MRTDRSRGARRALLVAGGGASVLLSAWASGCRPPDEIVAPAVTLQQVHVRQYSGGEARVELELILDNANDFAISLVGANLRLEIDGTAIGTITWTGQIAIRGSGATPAGLEAELAVGENAEVFSALIDRRPLLYALAGELNLARGVIARTLSVETSGRLNPDSP